MTDINFFPAFIVWIDDQLNVKNTNDLFLSFLMKNKNEVIGLNISQFPLENLNQYFLHFELLRDRDVKIIDTFEIQGMKKSVRFFVKHISSENSFCIIGIDLSNDVFREESIEQSRQQQEENARFMLMGQMSAGVAHEINNPLAIISGYLTKIKRSLNKEEEKINTAYIIESVSKATQAVQRITLIVKALKFLTRNELNSPFENAIMGDIINTVLDLSSEKFKTSGIELIIDKYDIQEPLNCRPVQIAQVILNLLMNSYDAVENLREKWVKVSINQKENSLVISITDSGTGIPVSIRNQIMLPFFTTKSTGAGIGLSTSKMILEDHKAELNYDDTCSNTKFDLIFKRS